MTSNGEGRFSLSMLGPVSLCVDGRALPVGGPLSRRLLGMLLVHCDAVVSAGRLVEVLWGDNPPDTATSSLHTYVSRLRRLLPSSARLETVPPGYRLVLDRGSADVERFEAALARGLEQLPLDPRAALGKLDEALAEWQGEAYAEFRDEWWARAETSRLDELRLQAREARVDALLGLGRDDAAVSGAQAITEEHPGRERAWRVLVLGLHRSGRQGEALRCANRYRSHLREEQGLDPSEEFTNLEHAVAVDAPGLRAARVDRAPGRPAGAGRSQRAGSNLPRPTQTVFVGREPEIRALRAWWGDAASAERMALVVGEPGVGKTGLVSAFAREVEGSGTRVLYGRADEDGGSAYEPVLGALRQFVVGAEDEVIEAIGETAAGALSRLVPELVERRPNLAAQAATGEEIDRSWLLGAVADGLNDDPESPVLVVLDDLHWADRPALLLLSRLPEPDRPIRVLGTCRTPTSGPSVHLSHFLADLRRDDRPLRRIELGGLTRVDVVDLVTGMAVDPLSVGGRAFASDLHGRTDGNPFFIRETLHHLEDTGAIAMAEGRWTPDRPLDELGIPAGVTDVVGHRLSSLSGSARDALRTAGVLGPAFDLDIVAGVLSQDEEKVLVAVEEALAAGLVQDDPGHVDRYTFVHALVRDVLLAELSVSRRARLAWRAGEVLEALRPAELDERAGELARHFVDGVAVGDPDRAVGWCLRAGAGATARLAYEEAVHCYEMALGALALQGAAADQERVDVLIALGRAANSAGDPERRRAACSEAASLARGAGDAERLAHAAISLLGTLGSGAATDDSVIALMEEAAGVLRSSAASPPHDALLAELLARLSGYLSNTRPFQSAQLVNEALAAARRGQNRRGLALALVYSTQTYALERAEHQGRLREAAQLAEEAGDLDVVLTANSNLMAAALMWTDRDEFDRRLAEYARVAGATGASTPLVLSAIDHAGAASLDGRYGDAREQFRDALRRSEPLGDPNLRPNIAAGMIPVNRELGRLALRLPAYRRDPYLLGSINQVGLVFVLCEAGELGEATERLETFLAQPDELRSGFLRRYRLVMLAEAAAMLGHVDAAARLSGWLEAELRSGQGVIIGPHVYFGAIHRYLGLLALTLGEASEAVDHHEAALDIHERMRAQGWAARTRYDLARALLARGRAGDSERAARLVEAARDAASDLGMPKLHEELVALNA